MYKDIYHWLEINKKVDSKRLSEIRKYALENRCSDIQAVVDSKVCSREEIIRAVKEIYLLETFEGNTGDLKPVRELSVSGMVDDGYMVSSNPYKPGEVLLLISRPQSKLALMEKVRAAKVTGNISVMFMFNSDFDIWKKSNEMFINDTKMNTVVSNIGVVNDVKSRKYEADQEEIDSDSVVGIVNKLISAAVDSNASDIHIEPSENKITVRFRIDGVLKVHTTISNVAIHGQIVNRIKILAGMDTNNFQTPQSGKINMSILDKEVDMRISTLPSIYGEKVTIRILVSRNVKIRTLEELGVKPNMAEKLRYLAANPHGIILVSGPTGSGKSSTLASIMTELNSEESCIITIEDPVEYKIDGATQVNVSDATGLTFASVLREVLRQDPDIIMVGEIRDVETAKIAVAASNTGHLVFSTIHTNGAVGTLSRLADMGVEPYMIADSLIGVLSQRLVKVLCDKCRKPHEIDLIDIKKYRLPKSMVGKTVYNPCGCHYCNKGYKGRTIVPELLEMNSNIRAAIHDKKSSQEVESLAERQGMKKQLEYAYELALEGTTSLEEVYRKFGGVQDEETDTRLRH